MGSATRRSDGVGYNGRVLNASKKRGRKSLCAEDERLRWAWDRHPQEYLDSYLVSGVEDPRINFQSILTRALIADSLFPGRFDELIDAEWRFGLCLTWLIRRLPRVADGWALLEQIERGDETECPRFLIDTWHALQQDKCPLPDYVSQAFGDFLAPDLAHGAPVLSTFERMWNEALAGCPDASVSVLEAGCGSANDYRFIVWHGLGRFVRYTGFDISAKNIANARRRFPDTRFVHASVLDIPAEQGEYDYVFAHDLFEHLSPSAFEQAIGEVCRVAKKEAWLSFFNMDDISQQEFRDIGKYHLNRFSAKQTVKLCLQHAAKATVINIPRLVAGKFGYQDYYNQHARTIIVAM